MSLRTLAAVGEAHDSLCYAPLRIRGIKPSVLSLFRLETVVDDAAGEVYWRVPVDLADGVVVTSLLMPVRPAGEPAAVVWEGPRRPDVLYGAWLIAPGEPVVIVPGPSQVWLLASLDIRACTFLCASHSHPPDVAIAQLAAGRPACCVVLDNVPSALPSGAVAVTRALCAAGLTAGVFTLPDLFHGAFPITVSDWVHSVGCTHDGVMAGLCALAVLGLRPEPEMGTRRHRMRAAS